MSILSLMDVKKFFPTAQGVVRAVDGVSFDIGKGETLGLVGESGSGKSTVAYTVIGSHAPTSGSISFEGEDIGLQASKRPLSIKKRLQIVFQDPGTSLNSARTIRQTLEVPLKVHGNGMSRQQRLERVVGLLDLIQLPPAYMHKTPGMLSGGEKQMVGIARALATGPSFVILDEPTSALDVSVQAKIITMLMDFQRRFELSYLFITHDLSLMRNVASRVAIMYLGKLCEVAGTSEFFRNPLHPYTQLLLSSIPVLSDEEERLKPGQVISRGEIPSPVNIPSGCSFHLRCHRKMEICEHKDPEMVDTDQGHRVRCHLYP
ncbi:MAG: ABC transporter ATP-binding protein [Desulfobacteraceae bacterium]|nr:ABC transporter ATP-binding protein [Desulfobacteraceae bacterium]